MFLKVSIVFLFLTLNVCALDVTLGWNRNPESTVLRYKVLIGESSNSYTKSFFVRNTTVGIDPSVKISNLKTDRTYFFAVIAVNSDGLESPTSNELVLNNAPANPSIAQNMIAPISNEQISVNKSVNLGVSQNTISTAEYPHGSFSSSWSLPENGTYVVEKSTDLVTWVIVGTVNVTNGFLKYTYTIQQGESTLFLRVGKVP